MGNIALYRKVSTGYEKLSDNVSSPGSYIDAVGGQQTYAIRDEGDGNIYTPSNYKESEPVYVWKSTDAVTAITFDDTSNSNALIIKVTSSSGYANTGVKVEVNPKNAGWKVLSNDIGVGQNKTVSYTTAVADGIVSGSTIQVRTTLYDKSNASSRTKSSMAKTYTLSIPNVTAIAATTSDGRTYACKPTYSPAGTVTVGTTNSTGTTFTAIGNVTVSGGSVNYVRPGTTIVYLAAKVTKIGYSKTYTNTGWNIAAGLPSSIQVSNMTFTANTNDGVISVTSACSYSGYKVKVQINPNSKGWRDLGDVNIGTNQKITYVPTTADALADNSVIQYRAYIFNSTTPAIKTTTFSNTNWKYTVTVQFSWSFDMNENSAFLYITTNNYPVNVTTNYEGYWAKQSASSPYSFISSNDKGIKEVICGMVGEFKFTIKFLQVNIMITRYARPYMYVMFTSVNKLRYNCICNDKLVPAGSPLLTNLSEAPIVLCGMRFSYNLVNLLYDATELCGSGKQCLSKYGKANTLIYINSKPSTITCLGSKIDAIQVEIRSNTQILRVIDYVEGVCSSSPVPKDFNNLCIVSRATSNSVTRNGDGYICYITK